MNAEERNELVGYLLNLPRWKLDELAKDRRNRSEVRELARRLLRGDLTLVWEYLDADREKRP